MREQKIKLDIGALTASERDGGNFVFFLYKAGIDKCIAVPLAPPEMHAVLSNFNKIDGDAVSIQNVFANVLKEYGIELLEVNITKEKQEKFSADILLSDGNKRILQRCSFADGVIMAKVCGCPIYATNELMEKYAIDGNSIKSEFIASDIILKQLKSELANAVEVEDYEKAAFLSKKIDLLNRRNNLSK